MSRDDQRLCDCGSGLRATRCCEADTAAQVSETGSKLLQPVLEKALEAHRAGRHDEAAVHLIDLLDLVPNHLPGLRLMVAVRKSMGQAKAAEALLRRVVVILPEDAGPAAELGLLLLNRGALIEAESFARQAVRLAPRSWQAHNVAGMVLTERGLLTAGEYHYRQVLALTGQRDPILLANIAWNLACQGRTGEARPLYADAVAAAPTVLQSRLGWAWVEATTGDPSKALSLIGEIGGQPPNHPVALLALAIAQSRAGDHAASSQTLNTLTSSQAVGSLGPRFMRAMGFLFDRLGRHGDAFTAFTAARRGAQRPAVPPEATDEAGLAPRLRGFFTPERLRQLPRLNGVSAGPQPVFIIGAPEAGTELIENDLTAHPRFAPARTLNVLSDVVRLLPGTVRTSTTYPEALGDVFNAGGLDRLTALRELYLSIARPDAARLARGAMWFTDRSPMNEFHLPLMAMLFPGSPILHVQRHPLDAALSALASEPDIERVSPTDIEGIARAQAAAIEIVEHYRGSGPFRHLTVRIEDALVNRQGNLSRILTYIGEPFPPGTLSLPEPPPVLSLSHRPYRETLAAAHTLLKPVMERLGYVG